MRLDLMLALLGLILLGLHTGCSGGGTGAQKLPIGSTCAADTECGGMPFHCMMGDHPGGYCMRGCDIKNGDADCPAEAICQYDGTLGECHKKCTGGADCRSGYVCSPAAADPMNKASHAFCDVAPAPDDGGTHD